ncbi:MULTISPECIES: polymer-forming cytoskeletal protein [unclassified Treponema]|jgi:cytoskeletal protein CcmA (bactofilin family)|uniref:bactofilin family protein n=1 Tax=unclassified Treponema TaxID=2638727 RepID=UPI001B27F23E|nr:MULTISPECIES: polymer-forming cytoskeletal protein [unclassified Treponema]MBO6219969.1 polymer-forming cytoskeletal protein [Treponema sp.]MBQ8680833.1 polymer-forming cytoskeletal protein [Treponema sp.]
MFDAKDSDFFDLEEEDFDTILAPDIAFRGTIRFAKPFMIRGIVTGEIDATSDLVVDTNAVVTAGINAQRVLVRGKVDGNIMAKDVVFVTASGSVNGDIISKEVVLEPGAHFSGKCTMTGK